MKTLSMLSEVGFFSSAAKLGTFEALQVGK